MIDTAEIPVLVRRIMIAVGPLDSIVKNKYANDRPQTRRLNFDQPVEKAPAKSKPPPAT